MASGPSSRFRPIPPDQRWLNAASNAAPDGSYDDSFRTKPSASGEPTRRSMPAYSPTTESGLA